MLALAHTGIVLGAAALLTGALKKSNSSEKIEDGAVGVHRCFPKQVSLLFIRLVRRTSSWLTTLGKYVDIRFLFIGALLPDIIDKPLGHLFFREALGNGRIFAHTLLFVIVIALIGLYLYRSRGQLWLLAIAFGTMVHLILDQMWQAPETLLWPVFGFAFPKGDVTGWIPGILETLLSNPAVYITEMIGAGILIWFAWFLLRRKKALAFIARGKIS